MVSFSINPISLIRSLSMALELAINGINTHHWRTAALCQYLAGNMDMPLAEKQNMFCAALLHDIGAASNFNERRKLADPDQEGRSDIFNHAEAGYQLLKDSLSFSHAAELVRHHHDSWEGGNLSGLAGDAIPLCSRIIYVADRVEVMIDSNKSILGQRDEICREICREKGTRFDPMVVDALMECAGKDCFWLDMGNPSYPITFFQGMDNWGQARYNNEEIMNIARMFAKIIDRMSVFTAAHSYNVSQVAVMLARQQGYSEMEVFMMEVAGLLHDLGKLSVPNEILEKPGPLSHYEMQIIRQHTYYTYRILEQVDSFSIIAAWAAFHHETLDGSGYPFSLSENVLPLGSRLMTVADIFVALAEDRPYRKRMQTNDIYKVMRDMIRDRKIDARIAENLFDMYRQAQDIINHNMANTKQNR